MKSNFLSATSLTSPTSLASVTYTPSIAARLKGDLARTVRRIAIPASSGTVLAASMATLLVANPTPAAATVILSGTNYTAGTLVGTYVIGDRIASGVGYTLVDGNSVSGNLLATRSGSSTFSTTGTVAASGTMGLAVTGVASSIISGGSDTFSVAVKPTVTGALTNTFNYNSWRGTGATQTTVVTVKTTAVAPLASVANTVTITTRAGAAAGTGNITVKNIGNGNLAGLDDGNALLSNQRGSVASRTGTFTGAGGAVNLADGASQNYAFTYSSATRGSASTTVTTTLSNGLNNANSSGTATTTLTGTAVGPDYAAALNTSGNAIGSGATVSFGDAAAGVTKQSLLVSNISNDKASTALTNMTITASIIGDAASEFSFSLSGFFSGNAANSVGPMTAVLRNAFNSSDLGNLAVQFVSKTGGTGSAQLRIQTDEESALGSMGSSIYVYNLVGTVPEPGTMMVLGTGLLGLAMARRNRRGKAEAAALTARDADAAKT